MTDALPPDTLHPDIDEKLLQRVRALLAKAESTEFEDEALAFTAKAHELMATHAIDRAVVEERAGSGGVISVRLDLAPPYPRDKFRLLSAVARYNRCRAVFDTRERSAMVFGHRSDLDIVELLFTSLLLQATNVMVAHGPEIDEWGQNRTRAFRHSFLVGFADGIGQRLAANQRSAEANAETTTGGSVLPVLVRREAEVEQAVDEAFPHLRGMRTTLSSAAGLTAGRRAADRADLGRQRVSRGQ